MPPVGAFSERVLEVERKRAGIVWGRFDGDERLDLLVAGANDVTLYFQDGDGRFAEAVVFPLAKEVRGGLFDLADLDADGRTELVVLHRSGVDRFVVDRESGTLRKLEPALARGLRGLAFSHLRHEDFLYDIDGDGDEDFAFPQDGRYTLYLQKQGRFERAGQVKTRAASVRARVGPPALAEELRSRIVLPRLRLEDADGDGRLDLRRSDGTWVPLGEGEMGGEFTATAVVDDPLKGFKERHGIDFRSGQGFQIGTDGTDLFQALLQDVDADGRPDYTIIHGNRIWVYKATADGFDFERSPDQLLKVSAVDRIVVLLLPLDADPRPELVIFKFEVPSIARLIAALAIGLRAEVEVLGYDNDGDPVFSRKPAHRSTFVIKVPPLLRLIGQLEEIGEQFQDIFRPIQGTATGDFNGDGVDDVLKLGNQKLEIFLTRDGKAPIDLTAAEGEELMRAFGGQEMLREALFGEKRKDVTLESSMAMMRDLVSGLQSAIVAGREPAASLPLGADVADRIDQIVADDLNGDSIDDIVVFLDAAKPEPGEDLDDELQTLRLWISEPVAASGDAVGALPQD